MSDTIFALSSSLGKSAVAIIRISGPATKEILETLTKKEVSQPRVAQLRNIYHPHNNIKIDSPLVIYFKAPYSFTGEDMAEIHIHGSKIVIKTLYEALNTFSKTRIAEAGEFSKRAFYNNKLDLTEAEGIIDLINAETMMQHEQALREMKGEIKNIYDKWREELIKILAYIEANIDFADEEIPQDIFNLTKEKICSLKQKISTYLNDNNIGEKIREGFLITILGEPNVGKSSLLNKIVKRDVAIVSEYAGTTRDVIETYIDLFGYPVIFADTAGLRETNNFIEAEGIKRAKNKASLADIKLLVIEAGNDISSYQDLIDEKTIIVVNKTDLLSEKKADQNNIIYTSVLNNEGLDKLLLKIKEYLEKQRDSISSPIITRLRHRELLTETVKLLNAANENKPIELIAEDLRLASRSLGKITGKIEVEELLNVIFKDFCIGK